MTIEELTPVSLRSLQSTGVMRQFSYRLVRPAVGSYGMALWSVYPLDDVVEWYADGHPELRAWVELPGGRRLRLDELHTTAPYEGTGEPALWAEQMGTIQGWLANHAHL